MNDGIPRAELDRYDEQDGAAPSQNGRTKSSKPRFPEPIPAGKLAIRESQRIPVWQGVLEAGGVAMLSALWKAGKTTWMAHLIREAEKGGRFCGLELKASRILYVTEEAERLWAERRDKLDIRDHVSFLIRPFCRKPNFSTWVSFIAYMKEILQERPAEILILDTLSGLWPVVEENDAGQVQAALILLHEITALGCCVLLVHHLGKRDGKEGTGSRGSGALASFVDVILELRRLTPGDAKDRRRVITTYSRLESTPEELVIELSEDGLSYDARGELDDIKRQDRLSKIEAMLPDAPPGLTQKEIREKWLTSPKPSSKTLANDLPSGIDKGLWSRTGKGVRNDPFRYLRFSPRGY
jgi:hypothetical protein